MGNTLVVCSHLVGLSIWAGIFSGAEVASNIRTAVVMLYALCAVIGYSLQRINANP